MAAASNSSESGYHTQSLLERERLSLSMAAGDKLGLGLVVKAELISTISARDR